MQVRVSVYVRVSTQRQAHSQTIEQQLERLKEHIAKQGWALDENDIHRDDGYTGSSLNRPGLDRLREAIREGEVSHVVITAPDRLARSYVHQTLLMDEFKQAGVQVIFLDRPMSEDPHDQLLLQIRGAVAEYERTLIADRMRRGRQMKFRAGKLLPWTRVPFGYRVDPDHPRDPHGVRIDSVEAAIVREMFEWYADEGRSLFGLAHHLQSAQAVTPSGKRRWNPASIRGILTNPAYTGQVYMGRARPVDARERRSAMHPTGRGPKSSHVPMPREKWILIAQIPAIIDQEMFEHVQNKLAHNQAFAQRNNTAQAYLLRALVSCGACKSSCVGRRVHEGYVYYTCRGKADLVQACRDEKCQARFIPAGQLDDLVWQDLWAVLTHPESLRQAFERAQGGHWLPQELQARRETLRKAHASLTSQLDRLTQAYLSSVIALPEYQRRRAELQAKFEHVEAQDRQLNQSVDRQAETAALAHSMTEFCQRVQAGLASATFEHKRQLVELLIDRVVVTNDQVEIRYVIPTSPKGELTRFCHLRLDYFPIHLVRVRTRNRVQQGVSIAWQAELTHSTLMSLMLDW